MPNPYRELFSAPGSRAFAAAGFLARIPLPMTGIGVITMLSQPRGEYALAGAVAAVFTLSTALLGPRVSRLVDRRGQGRVLVPAAAVSVVGLGLLLLCAHFDAPKWTLFVCAVPAGAMPNMAAMVRARWSELYRGSPRLHTALSFESVVDELTFVIGPALSVALSTMVFPEAGLLVAAGLLTAGVLLFAVQRGTEPPVDPRVADSGSSAIRDPRVVRLVLIILAGGAIVGTVDVISVAFADQQGHPAAAGAVLSAYAVGSAVAGLAFGALNLRIPLPRLLVLGVLGTATTTLPLLFVSDVVGLAVVVLLAGVFFAPTMIVLMSLVERIVPVAQLTEGMTWVITGLSAGVALGSAVAGQAVDAWGPRGGAVVAVVAGAVGLLIALVSTRSLARAAG